MNDADNLALLGRVMGGLLVVLVLIGLIARVARRTHGQKATSGLRVIDRVGLSREANLTVIEVANRVLLLGVTAQGVTMLADLDVDLEVAAAQDAARTDGTGFEPEPDDHDQPASAPAVPVARTPSPAIPERGTAKDRSTDAESPRRPMPPGVALEQYPDLASALRAAGRTSGSSQPAAAARPAMAAPAQQAMPTPGTATPAAPAPRTRAEARAVARARAAAGAQTGTQTMTATPPAAAWFTSATFPEVDRIPLQRNDTEAYTRRQSGSPASAQLAKPAQPSGPAPSGPAPSRPAPSGPAQPSGLARTSGSTQVYGPTQASGPAHPSRPVQPAQPVQASGSVLSPRTWRQGIEALRDLTVRRG